MRTITTALLVTLASTGAWASSPSVDASMYTVHCDTMIGTISFRPPLSASGTATSGEGKVKASLAGCTATPDDGNPPVTIESGSVSGKLLGTSDNCNILLGGAVAAGDLTIKWKTTPKLADSSSVLTVGTLSFSPYFPGAPFTGIYGAFHIGGFESGVSVTGSFQGVDGGTTSVVDGTTGQDVTALLGACAGDSGLKKINFGFGDITLQ